MVGFRLTAVIVCFSVILMNVDSSHVREMQRVKRETKVKVCGNQLVNMLRIICSHKGNFKKKSVKSKKTKTKNRNKKDKKTKNRKGRKQNRSENLTVKQRKRSQRKQGMVDRCCFSSCTIGQLYQAC
eukprot:TRINITY_DN39316_c0_g1_i1.p1 TRINITY_DN39316_c0_g1~~TRINITY_DN39316_c0_g1_i1.p1  ORF type:complete len:127 (+),score=28.05 TRINITY_DN39316_c0_g1_i1:79-459(+)